jgi:long-chain acyl-CoA synthetase
LIHGEIKKGGMAVMAERDLSFMRNFGYPEKWLQESSMYGVEDSYLITQPGWSVEPIPPIPEISIYEIFAASARKYPDDVAVIFLDRKITYRDMDDMINRYASLLLDLGVRKGDVVATMLPNCFQHWLAFFGANRIGAAHTPLNVMYKDREIAYQIKNSGAKTVVTFDVFYQLYFAKLRDEIGLQNVIVTNLKDFASPDTNADALGMLKPFWDAPKRSLPGTVDLFDAIARYQPTREKVACNPREDTALILYTSGTTSAEPKGVIETHFNLVFNALSHSHMLITLKKREVNFSIMPMFHTAGYFLHTLPVFYQGGTVIPIPLFMPDEALRIMSTQGVNTLFAPPTLYIALMQNPRIGEVDLSSLELTVGCGAPVPVAVMQQWEKRTGLRLTNGWGMTETNCGGCMSIAGRKEMLDSIGIPIGCEIKIVDEKGHVVPRGQIGEAMVRGFQVAKGYLNKPAQTEATFLPDGWMHTGDTMFIDTEDFVHFVDRGKDLIIASGYNITPVEVENVIYEHPAVLETAVVGIPHEYRGETVKAFVALKPGFQGKVTEQEIIDFCKDKLATFKVPRYVEFIDAIPKNVVGKALRRVLREQEIEKAKARKEAGK